MPSATSCVDDLVSAFTANGYQPLGADTDPIIPTLLKPLIEALAAEKRGIVAHGFDWNPVGWQQGLNRRWSSRNPSLAVVLHAIGTVDRHLQQRHGQARIQRDDLHLLSGGDPLHSLVAIMAWGWGTRGRAWTQFQSVAEKNGSQRQLTGKLVRLRRLARAGDPTQLARSWIEPWDSAHLTGLRAAFGSKFAYAAVPPERPWRTPLIADRWVAWALWMLVGLWDVRTSPEIYRRYVEAACRWADACGCWPDEVERALFEIGPSAMLAWRRRARTLR